MKSTLKKTLLFLLTIILQGTLRASASVEEPEKIGIYENLDGYIPENVMVLNQDSNWVNFRQLINKPTVLTLVYYTCPGICSPLLDGVAELIEKTDLTLGKDYQVLTVSFNYNETPFLAGSKRKNYLAQVNRKIDENGWQFFTADSINIYRLTNAVGFMFKRDGKDFIHAATIIVISPEGKITRYLYGTKFLPFDLKMSVLEANKGISSPTISKVLQFCFSYDVKAKKYALNFTRVGGALVLIFALIIFLFLTLKKKKPLTVKE